MKRLLIGKKGTSAVLATLLMVMVTMASGIMFYNYVMGHVEGMKTNVSTQLSLLLLESANINVTHITAFVRNVGNNVVSIVNAYVNDVPALLSQSIQIAPVSLGVAYVGGAYTKGVTYTVKLASVLGTSLTFKISF